VLATIHIAAGAELLILAFVTAALGWWAINNKR